MDVSARVVLHEIAGDEYNIRRPCRRLLRVGKRSLERGQRCDPAQCFRLAPVEVRVGELYEAQNAHDFDIASRILLVDCRSAGRVPVEPWPACNQSVTRVRGALQ
jgi:hypothetical protein